MEDHWKALNEKGVAVISPEIVCTSSFYIWYYILAHEDKEDYDNSDISLDVLNFWQLSDLKKLFIPYIW